MRSQAHHQRRNGYTYIPFVSRLLETSLCISQPRWIRVERTHSTSPLCCIPLERPQCPSGFGERRPRTIPFKRGWDPYFFSILLIYIHRDIYHLASTLSNILLRALPREQKANETRRGIWKMSKPAHHSHSRRNVWQYSQFHALMWHSATHIAVKQCPLTDILRSTCTRERLGISSPPPRRLVYRDTLYFIIPLTIIFMPFLVSP